MKQEENKNFLANEQKLEGFENQKVENQEKGKKKENDATAFVATAAVVGGAALGSVTSDMTEESAVDTADNLVAQAKVEKPSHAEPAAVEPEVVTPTDESVELQEETPSEEGTEVTPSEEGTEEKPEEVTEETTNEGETDLAENTEEIPIVEVNEEGVEQLDIAAIDPVDIGQHEDVTLHADIHDIDVVVTPGEPIDGQIPGIDEPNHQIELAYQEKNLIDTDEFENRVFSVKEKTIMQDGEAAIPAVNIVDAEGNEFLLADVDGDGLYEAVYDSDGEFVAQAKGGITESDIDEALDEILQEEDIFVDGPESSHDALIYDEDDSIVDDIEGLDVGDTDLA